MEQDTSIPVSASVSFESSISLSRYTGRGLVGCRRLGSHLDELA